MILKSKANSKKEVENEKNPLEKLLISKLIQISYDQYRSNKEIPLGILLAASFDLVVSAEYYSAVSHRGWFYCPEENPVLYYHFTNCCPRHAIKNQFHFHSSSKPESGSIGNSTSKLLRNFYSEIIAKNNRSEKIYKGSEPVDAIIINEREKNILFAEIKASPLLILPLVIHSEPLHDENNDLIKEHDEKVTISSLYNNEIYLFVPKKDKELWIGSEFLLGTINHAMILSGHMNRS